MANRNPVHRIITAMASANEPAISVQKYKRINDSVYSVAFTADRGDYPGELLSSAFSKVFTGAFTVASGTLMDRSDRTHNLYTAIVTANTENHAFTEQTVNDLKLKVVTANVFTDDNDNVWKAVGEGDNKRIVLTSTDDYEKILASRRSRSVITAALDTAPDMEFGDLVYFYNPLIASTDIGHASSSNTVLAKSSGLELEILPEMILEVAEAKSLDINPLSIDVAEATAAQLSGKKAFLAYWAKIYAKTPVYKDLEKLMSKYAKF